MRNVDEELRALDPARLTSHEGSTQASAQLGAILSTGRTVPKGQPPRPRRWILASAGVATAMTALIVVVDPFSTTSQPAYAMTPEPLRYEHSTRSAGEALEEIAQRIEGIRDNRPAAWSSEHFVTEGWSLSTSIDGTQVTSAVIPEHRETWEKADGSSQWTARTLRPQFQNEEQRKTWENAGSVGKDPKTWSDSSEPSKTSNAEPPSTPGGMKEWLAAGHASLSPDLAFEVIPERFRDHVFSPAQRAALLRVLKETEGIVYEGTVEDRAKRTGEAFSLTTDSSGLPNKRTLVFDSSTGDLFAYEEELTTDAGKLNVKAPAVIDYTTFLTAERIA
ncbi:CU044_5270 family protein [Streptomyces sp. NPDC050988]|uniref:CU044_5270 family protein n=1 Tax=Streptomyces sp. NPDC050988 TaxID=3365637 RepID=UPI003789058A